MTAPTGPGFAVYQPSAGHEASGPLPVTIRPIGADDLGPCAALIVSRTGGDPAARRERLAADAANGGHHLLVAVVNREIAGFGQVVPFAASTGAPADTAPNGHYLTGLIVGPRWRRRGIGERLTLARMAWVAERADTVWYFANARNHVTLDLHRRLGFAEVTRRFTFPGVTFDGGAGVLLRAYLR